jgi:hypothetical protein
MQPRSLTIPDARGSGAYLRITRHPEQRKVVISHWRDDLCVASTPVELVEVPALIGVLADVIGDVVRSSDPLPANRGDSRFLARIKAWLRPRLAQIVELRDMGIDRDRDNQKHTG